MCHLNFEFSFIISNMLQLIKSNIFVIIYIKYINQIYLMYSILNISCEYIILNAYNASNILNVINV